MNELSKILEKKDLIVEKLQNGKPLTQICREDGYPSLNQVYTEIRKNKDFANEIAQARKVGAQTYLDAMIEELESANNKNIYIIREKLHHYRWMASKLLPGIYGDKQEIKQDTKIEITWNTPDETKIVDVKPIE